MNRKTDRLFRFFQFFRQANFFLKIIFENFCYLGENVEKVENVEKRISIFSIKARKKDLFEGPLNRLKIQEKHAN